MTLQPKPISRPWWKYLRLSVGALIVVVLLIGVCLGWLVSRARVQREAVAAIKKAGGSVLYEWESSDTRDVAGGRPWAPRWLVAIVGADSFGHVTEVDFTTATDVAMVHVGRLTRTKVLTLAKSSISDAGLAHLQGLRELLILNLAGTQVTDAGLVHVKGLNKLATLLLDGTDISDCGLVHLAGLSQLEVLDLTGTAVSDAGLIHLRGQTGLRHLDLIDTWATPVGARELRRALPNARIIQRTGRPLGPCGAHEGVISAGLGHPPRSCGVMPWAARLANSLASSA